MKFTLKDYQSDAVAGLLERIERAQSDFHAFGERSSLSLCATTGAGKTVMSIHTYRKGGALGNEMFEGGKSALQPGDRIVLHGPDGQVACYDFLEAKKIDVTDYDPESDVMVDYEGDPLLTMIICWDHRKGTDEWDSRVFFYAKPYVGD